MCFLNTVPASPLLSISRAQLLVFYDLLHELLKADKIWNSINSMTYNLDDPNLEEGNVELQVNPYDVYMYTNMFV